MQRRTFLSRMTAAGISGCAWVGGCGYYLAGRGAAYAPWDFPDPDLPARLQIVHAGLLAASPHNTQPWWFAVPDEDPTTVELWADTERDLGTVDPLRREMFIGLGCAVENMIIGARAIGSPVRATIFPDPEQPELVARFAVGDDEPHPGPLYEAIGTRHTNRGEYAAFDLDPRIVERITDDAARFGGVTLTLLTSKRARRDFAEGTVAATKSFIDDREMLRDSDAWFRHTKDEILEHRDGPTLDASVQSETTVALAKAGRPVKGERGAAYWLRATQRVHTGPCSAFALLSTTDLEDHAQHVMVGRAYQRLALRLEALGLATQPINQLPEMRDREVQLGEPPRFGERLAALSPTGVVQLAFRLGYAWDGADPAPRRPLDWVVLEGAFA